MSPIKNQLNAITRFLVAESEVDRAQARKDMLEQLSDTSGQLQHNDVESEVKHALLELGVPDRIYGHRYLVKSICSVVEKPDLIHAVTKELYPIVAKASNATPSKAERAIRHAIELAWERGDLDVLYKYFGNTVSCVKGKPTNSEFIARVSNVIRERVNG